MFTNAPCKTTCLYNAPSMHTVDIFPGQSYGPGGLKKKLKKCPSASTGTKIQFPRWQPRNFAIVATQLFEHLHVTNFLDNVFQEDPRCKGLGFGGARFRNH